MNSISRVLVVTASILATGVYTSNQVQAEQESRQYSNNETVQSGARIEFMKAADRSMNQSELQMRKPRTAAGEREIPGVGNASHEQRFRQRLNEDNSRGQGMQKRERQRIENDYGYGQGYGSRHGMSAGSRGR